MRPWAVVIRQTIHYLTRLRRTGKPISLKLYADPPLFKLAILGDHIWLQHYHQELDVRTMPQYVFKHNQNNHGLYTLFYLYFMTRWESREIPQYDLETNMLVSRDHNHAGVLIRRSDLAAAAHGDVLHRQIGSVHSP